MAFAGRCALERPTPTIAPKTTASVQRRGPPATRANPFRDRFPVRALAAGVCLLAGPARAEAHRAVPARTFLRLDCVFCFLLGHRATLNGPRAWRNW